MQTFLICASLLLIDERGTSAYQAVFVPESIDVSNLARDARAFASVQLALADYSASTAAGFTRAARRAGSHVATSATVASRSATPTTTTGSVGLTP